jgi:hypothetical protein
MLRSCLAMLLVYAALVAGYYWWLSQMFDPPGVWIGAAIVGLLAAFCLGSIINAGVAYREWSLLAAARHDLPWSDGRWTAVAGEIHPVSEPLVAPFSGEPCVMCEYDVGSQHRISQRSQSGEGNPGSDFAGFLMNPSVVRTRMGDVRLLGFPNLTGFADRVCTGFVAAKYAREFLTATPFEDYSGLKMVSVVSAITDAWTDDDGLVRKNIRLAKIDPQSLFPAWLDRDVPSPAADEQLVEASKAESDEMDDEDLDEDDFDDEDELDASDSSYPSTSSNIPLLKEKRVRVGDTVCAIGIYNSAKGGLVPGGLGADRFIKLIRGRLADVERQARNSTFARFFGGLIALALINAATYGVMMANRYHPAAQEPRQREAFNVVGKGDVARLEKLIARGVDVNAISGDGLTPLAIAAQTGRLEIVKLLLAANADPNLRRPSDNRSALDLARANGHDQIVALLKEAGAQE